MIKVHIKVELNPTEEPEKIMTVINNFATVDKNAIKIEELAKDYFVYSATIQGRSSLQAMFNGLRNQRTVESARKHLMRKMREEGVSFLLNKQALFMNKFHFCHSLEESPMGPVWIRIDSDDILRVLEYLVPHTIKGQPQEVNYLPD